MLSRRRRSWLIATALVLPLSGCSTLGYYWQSVEGQLRLMSLRRPVASLIDSPATSPALRARLERAREILHFAHTALALPDNGSYRSYSDLGRRYATWTVVATPALSLRPLQWCFPVVGCLSYRGYFHRADALGFANRLAVKGFDVAVAGATAYSTLGWFDDPLLNTMLDQPDYYVAATLFHELAHERVYVPGDSAFDESYAVTVERVGTRRWLAAHGSLGERAAYARALARQAGFLRLVDGARTRLAALYASSRSDADKRARKARIFAGLRADYVDLKRSWGGYAGYDGWFRHDLDNAKLALVATYNGWVPAFTHLLAEQGGDMARFHAAVARLAALPRKTRDARLRALMKGRAGGRRPEAGG